MPAKRPLWAVVGALLLAAAALWGSSRLAWASEQRRHPGTDESVTVLRSGADLAPLTPLALLALAGVAAAVALGGWPRRALGAVLAAAGVTAVGLALFTGGTAGLVPWGRGLTVLGGVSLLIAGGLLVQWGDRLPRLGAAYQTPQAARRAADPDGEMWQSLSHGEDPTTDER